ncbi:MAG TPA: hypothetical protein VIG53_00220 [Actinomycetota bacterium]|jgi:hypothetical protein
MNRKAWDQLVSTAALVIAVVLVLMGAAAIYGGNFGRDNVKDRLTPEKIQFPPLEAMTDEEKAEIGDFAGQQVVNGTQAEAFSRYIQGHLAFINEGQTYSETSAAARVEGLDPDVAAELQGKADTLFKGETLRAILLNAYGWWTVATIALFAGFVMVAAGIALFILAMFGYRHAKRAEAERVAAAPVTTKDYAPTNA